MPSFPRDSWQAFNHFDKDGDGSLQKNEVARALEILKIDIKYFEYVWLTLDIDNSGIVEYWEFVDNMTSNNEEILKVFICIRNTCCQLIARKRGRERDRDRERGCWLPDDRNDVLRIFTGTYVPGDRACHAGLGSKSERAKDSGPSFK